MRHKRSEQKILFLNKQGRRKLFYGGAGGLRGVVGWAE